MIGAIAGTDIQVYRRDPATVRDGKPFQTALRTYGDWKGESVQDAIAGATYVLMFSEMLYGGSGISPERAGMAVHFGFAKVSEPVILRTMELDQPMDEASLSEITADAMDNVAGLR